MANVQTVIRGDLTERRRRLLDRTGTTWPDLQRRADVYALTDDERSLFDTIRGIDWLLAKRR
jgi:hypothetical protein